MASPFLAEWNDVHKELVEPALEGTTTVLESVAKSKDTVRRVVLTSSFAGKLLHPCLLRLALADNKTGCLVAGSGKVLHTDVCACHHAAALKMKSGPANGKLYTEEDWNTESQADKEGGYMYSKVHCSTAADHHIDACNTSLHCLVVQQFL